MPVLYLPEQLELANNWTANVLTMTAASKWTSRGHGDPPMAPLMSWLLSALPVEVSRYC